MRGRQDPQVTMLAFMDLESRVPSSIRSGRSSGWPMRRWRSCRRCSTRSTPRRGRPSIPPERLLKASLLIALYSVRSERAFCEELDYHLLFRWFLDMSLVEPGFDASTFTKNRERLLKHEVGQRFFDEVVAQAQERRLLSDEHFTVDGTLIEAAASLKSFKRRTRPRATSRPTIPATRRSTSTEKRSNTTHQSTTDPEARLIKKGKGKEAKLCFMGHALMENRHGLLVDFQLTEATGTAERDVAPKLLRQARERGFHPKTLGGDKNYDTRGCVADMRACGVTPHVAQNTSGRRSAIDGRTTRHPGYAVSQRLRKRVEEIFGWMKTVGGFRRTRFRGLDAHRPGRLPRRHRLQPGPPQPPRTRPTTGNRRRLTRHAGPHRPVAHQSAPDQLLSGPPLPALEPFSRPSPPSQGNSGPCLRRPSLRQTLLQQPARKLRLPPR